LGRPAAVQAPFRRPSRGQRTLLRWIKEEPFRRPIRGKRAIIIGAGTAGERLLRQLQHDPRHPLHVVGLVDDDPAKHGRAMHGVSVLGGSDDLRGPVVGAIFLGVLSEMLWANAPQLYMIILGLLLVIFVLFVPEGICGRLPRPAAARR